MNDVAVREYETIRSEDNSRSAPRNLFLILAAVASSPAEASSGNVMRDIDLDNRWRNEVNDFCYRRRVGVEHLEIAVLRSAFGR